MDNHRLAMPVVDASAIVVATSPDGNSRAVAVRDAASRDDAVAVFHENALVRLVHGGLDDFARENGYSLVTDPASARRMVLELALVILPLDVEAPGFGHRRGMHELVEWSREHRPPTRDEIPVFPRGSGVLARAPKGFEYRRHGAPSVTLRLAPPAAPALAAVSTDLSQLALWDPDEGLTLVDARVGEPISATDTTEPLRALRFDDDSALTAIGASGAILMFGKRGLFGPLVQFWTVYDIGDEGSVGIDENGVILITDSPEPYEGKFVHCTLGEDVVPFESCVAYVALE